MKTHSEKRQDDVVLAKILHELVAELRLGRTAHLIPLTLQVHSTVGLPWPVERERVFSFSSGTRVHVVWTQAGRVIEITRADGSWGVSCKGGRPLETDDVGVSDRLEVQKLCQQILADEGDDLEDAADQAERLAERFRGTGSDESPVTAGGDRLIDCRTASNTWERGASWWRGQVGRGKPIRPRGTRGHAKLFSECDAEMHARELGIPRKT